ncbi:MAG: glycosyl hydrolase [Sedimentisphaerales bacterium]|jgi:hypothetical protein|nr:glycosyl hydrolase [Sedimentisphaerales bacterium]HNY80099.1 glycosyl hydrolase [Sedimentisphaerales bacterium]HOC65556.1 glycosyl hydrolase [Sedimentisphaerales bacterium]HOH66552.1 glycosyl hydrolase [Sedimentisphaerales bacterium]HPY50788.1 glycosyl hydrolase [Sedimentisphaerales bacterium]
MMHGSGKSEQFVRVLVLALSLFCDAAYAAERPVPALEWPAVTSQTKPWTRWWWMGSIVDEKNLTTEMQKYAAAGLGGLEITPIYGVKGYEDRFIDYLSPRWMEMLECTLKEARRLDLGVDMATGNGWPFGGPWVGAADACKNAVHKTYGLKAGERLAEPVTYVQRPMVRAIGRRLDISEIVEPISDNEDLQSLALEQVRFEKPLPLQVLMAYSDGGRIVNLTDKVAAGGELDWTAPAGNWTLYAVFQGWHGKMVERAGPGGEGDVIDHFSHEALERYLSRFDRAFAGHDVGGIRAYFNDSYEVDDAAGESNWTPKFFEQFERRRGYDLRSHLPALFGKDEPVKNAKVLCDYRETISDLLLEEFTTPWRRWAEGKGATTRNQAHGSPANLLDLYAASGIPETEGSDILGFKFASSAAHVTGKPLASCEAATWMAEHFTGTLGEARRWVDRYFLGGINHICYHGTTFSPPDEEWPGWMFYASVHFGPTNSFWNHFAALNQYVTRCQSFLQAGKPDNDVLLYWPIHDSWSQPGRTMLPHYSAQTPREIESAAKMLWDAGYSFDYVSDRQLAEIRCDKGVLRTGGVTYGAVVVPACQYIPVSTFETLLTLAQQGATIIVEDHLPADVPGMSNLAARRDALNKSISQLNFVETSASGVREARLGSGRFLLGDDVAQTLVFAGIERESIADRGLPFIRRTLSDGKCYFTLNASDEALNGWVPLRTEAASVAIFEPMRGDKALAALRKNGPHSEVYLQLAPGQSCILRTFDEPVQGPRYAYWSAAGQAKPLEGTWTVEFIEGGPELPAAVQTQTLRSWTDFGGGAVKRFSGTARYTIIVKRPAEQADGWLLDLGRVCESARVTLNGQELGTLISAPFEIVVPADRVEEESMLVIEVSNLMGNRIADLDRRGVNYKKFYNVNFAPRLRENRGPDGNFSAAKWSAQDSGLIGPVTLTPLQTLIP